MGLETAERFVCQKRKRGFWVFFNKWEQYGASFSTLNEAETMLNVFMCNDNNPFPKITYLKQTWT